MISAIGYWRACKHAFKIANVAKKEAHPNHIESEADQSPHKHAKEARQMACPFGIDVCVFEIGRF